MRPAALLFFALALPAKAASPAFQNELAGVIDQFYDMQFDKARAAAQDLAVKRPTHPAGVFYRGVSTFQRWIAEGMRSTETYHAFEVDNEASEKLSLALMKTNPAEAHYYLGATLGFRSRGYAAQKKFFRAFPDGASAVKHLKKALALDPSLTDARLGMGMYHYFAARMPSGAKPFAYLLIGESPDRKLGLEEIWSVAHSTGISRMEARSVLATILSKDDEADYAKAEELLAELNGRYPHNPIYRLRRAFVAEKLGNFDAAVKLADPDGPWFETLHPSVRGPARAWSLYRATECRLLQGRPVEAGLWLDALEKLAHPRGMKDWVVLRRANILDSQGRKAEADELYGRVSDKVPSALAERFRKARYPAGPKDAAPFFTGY